MYDELTAIAQLRFGKERDVIGLQTHQEIREASELFAATASAGIRSGQHDVLLGRLRIKSLEKLAHALFNIWVDLIKQLTGRVQRADLPFILNKVNEFVNAQNAHLNGAFAQQGGPGVSHLLAQEAAQLMYGVLANLRRDLEIMVREYEAFPRTPVEKTAMRNPPSLYSVGRRVLFGMANRTGIVKSVSDAPAQMGEFVYQLQDEKTQEVLPVLGCDIRPFPAFDEDLRMKSPAIHIENSNIANLNFGSQVGTINASLHQMSQGGQLQKEFAQTLQEFTQAIVSANLGDVDKQEVMEALATIAEQATKKPEERSKVTLKAVVAWMPHMIASAAHLTELWDRFAPSIRSTFGI